MATVQYTRVQPGAGEDIPTGIAIYQWVLAANDDGAPVNAPHFSGKAVQRVAGTSITTAIEGTLHMPSETEVWGAVHDPLGADLVLADAEVRQVLEDCVQIRPRNPDGVNGATVRLLITTPARR